MSIVSQGDKFLLHWLDLSRAHRILWLLEILELNYDVKVYLREEATWRAPPELAQVHPSGKSPILEIFHADGSPPLKLAELGYIIQYLIQNYDIHKILTPSDPRDRERVNYYLHYSEGTLQHLLVSILVNNVAKQLAPTGTKFVAKFVTNAINSAYYVQEWKLNMDNLEHALRKEGTGYFVGKHLTAADIILSFPIYENVFDNEEEVQKFSGRKINLSKTYPHLYAWSSMVRDDPLYIKIDEQMEDLVREKIAIEAAKKRRR